ncbi:hypothetical protein [Paragemmobacter ruber]|uniref:Class I SAM-dependent methyltransferase n=1 Tax=Paragemmobacter ruber TaxID=1985673 RepID=A0ABW9YAK6_9RHOB|nr:hypothetical protein [Rhodobacter ruber]NBE09647.1 hypothetical protein [Rhodobacter ruber]
MKDGLAKAGLVPERGRIAVYSCYFGQYEPFHARATGAEGAWDRIIFTDHADLAAPGCRVVRLEAGLAGFEGLTPKHLSRLPKLWPERFLAAYDWVIYVDNRARLDVSPADLIARLEAAQGGVAPAGRYLVRHQGRGCSWREAEVCHRREKLEDAEYARLRAWFAETGLPREAGLFVNTALVQKMGSEATARLNEAWFRAFVEIAGRDQVLLPNLMRIHDLPQQDLGMPLEAFVRWPIFGFQVRNRFRKGMALPDGWDDPPPKAVQGEMKADRGAGAGQRQEMQVQDFKRKQKLENRLAEEEARRLAEGHVIVGEDDMKLFRYGAEGDVDLELYRKVQTEANKMKIKNQFVPEDHIAILSRYMLDKGALPVSGICHGTRRGNEQMWFRQYLGPQAEIFGTEISDTATQFPHTIQWDFHEVDPAWVGAMDMVYSNSWDHAHDPERAFAGWISCLKPGGFLMLDHGWNYLPDRVSAMDPFGISEAGLVKMLNRLGAATGEVAEVIDGGAHKQHPIRTAIFRARA